jgi:kumamolisin
MAHPARHETFPSLFSRDFSLDLSPRRPLAASLAILLASAPWAAADVQPTSGGQVQVPESGNEQPADIGVRAHTHVRYFMPSGETDLLAPPTRSEMNEFMMAPENAAPYAGLYFVDTPASLACVYKLVTPVPGCNPFQVTAVPSGGSHAIAIVEAYDDATAAPDLAHFSEQFGLPAANFQVVYASGTKPPADSGWALEAALDIEWAHAMAPNAKIYLVEAASGSCNALFTAVTVASNLVAKSGGGEVSISWGSSEFASETTLDSYFTTPQVVYVASAGDTPGVSYPAASPNVIAVGGTTMSRNPNTGNFQIELSWQQTGGGPSAFEPLPNYQNGLIAALGVHRGTPDVAAIADPNTGVWVYQDGNWWIVGGTSLSAPIMAGVINAAGSFRASTAAELTAIYGNPAGFTNIVDGVCGPYAGYFAGKGWNLCAGNGSPFGITGK